MDYRDAYLLAGSEELSREFNDLAGMYSDFYKDVYGFRPRNRAMCACDYASEEALARSLRELKVDMARLEAASVEVFEREAAEQARALAEFEATITKTIALGAATRANAVRWLCAANQVDNTNTVHGWEHLEYLMGIPFGYIAKSMKVN